MVAMKINLTKISVYYCTIVQNPRHACKLSSLVQHGVVQTLD